ncbi:hypothetical protein MMC14_003873 [Varicellaria rhodocarpa]|nr:hypothetical protein [Varicellaria rhodocarpa]
MTPRPRHRSVSPIKRQALRSLSNIPRNKPPTITEEPSSLKMPLHIGTKASENFLQPHHSDVLTPPNTPHSPEKSCIVNVFTLGTEALKRGREQEKTSEGINLEMEAIAEEKKYSWEETRPKPYTRKYNLSGSASSGYGEFGRGVWSAVYRATESNREASFQDALTPPTSPITSPSRSTTPISDRKILAVKAPIRRDAHKILDNEARILTYLHQSPEAAVSLVAFHGYDAAQHSIVLDAHPLSLDTYVKTSLVNTRANLSTKTMFDPVVGSIQWVKFAKGLICGLDFLHSQGCVHGDIKLANILLQVAPDSSYIPLYCDFSSSHILSNPSSSDTEEVSAVTAEFTSPELLASFYRRNGDRAVATFTSDIFALGVTLLVAATGESPYAGARMELQKLAMAKEGKPMEFARGGDQASRIMRGKMVDKALAKALERDPLTRIDAAKWSTMAIP